MKKKSFLSVLLATAMLGSMVAAVPAAAADDDQTLTVWCWDPNFNIYAMQQAEKIYQEDHPDFKLDIQENVYSDIETKLITAATSGDYSTLPDIFLMQDYSYHKDVTSFPDVFTDLTDSGIDFSQFSAGKLADSTVDGKNYGVPFDNGATIMAIRSDIVEEAGLTTDDFKDITWSKFTHPFAGRLVYFSMRKVFCQLPFFTFFGNTKRTGSFRFRSQLSLYAKGAAAQDLVQQPLFYWFLISAPHPDLHW